MSIARSILLVSAGIALGAAGTMVANGEIDLAQQLDAYRSVGHRPPAANPLPPRITAAPPPPVVRPVPETVVVTLPSGNAPITKPMIHSTTGDRHSLAQELQSELQRLGCYAGSIDGVWTPLSQKAMKAFVERVNAQLPVDEPDYVLLALARGRRDKVCTVPCTLDQKPGADNGCAVARPAPERAPAALSRPAIVPGPSTPAGPAGGAVPVAGGPQAPGQVALAPGAAPPPAPDQKRKPIQQKPNPGPLGSDIFKRILGNY